MIYMKNIMTKNGVHPLKTTIHFLNF
ncbi:UNVERIFIED_CONTAM: hypothetical protein GTU68_037633 [Idotea baltica]|nr:hypothetical protein [Idotea baltica]